MVFEDLDIVMEEKKDPLPDQPDAVVMAVPVPLKKDGYLCAIDDGDVDIIMEDWEPVPAFQVWEPAPDGAKYGLCAHEQLHF